MRYFLLYLFCFLGLLSTYGQTLNTAKEVSIQIEEDDFNNSTAVNFFVGELSRYLQSQGVYCRINRNLSHTYDCKIELYVYVSFNYSQYLASNGCWSWYYSDISFRLVDGCGNKREIFIDDIKTPNIGGQLVKRFRKKLKNK